MASDIRSSISYKVEFCFFVPVEVQTRACFTEPSDCSASELRHAGRQFAEDRMPAECNRCTKHVK